MLSVKNLLRHPPQHIVVLTLSILLFIPSVTLHFTYRSSLAEFILALGSIVPLSTLFRLTVRNITIRLQDKDYELLSGLINSILGYHKA